MALWEDIAKSAKDAAAYTVKKTEELTSIAKIKMSIRSEENNLDKCFSEIGSMYYAYRDSLAKLQKSVICPGCSAQVTTEYDFCPLCGVKLKEASTAEEEKNTDGEA